MSILLARWFINALSLILATYLVPGISVTGIYSALIAALVLGLINALIRPFVIFLTLPINILTLGLFILIINASLFWFASTMVKGFYVADFRSAFWGALVVTVVSWLTSSIFKNNP